MTSGYDLVDMSVINAVLNTPFDKGLGRTPFKPYGRFLAKAEDGSWTAVDNSTGDAWTECFSHRDIAVRWLREDIDTDRAHELDDRRTAREGGQ